jgi:peptidoglycan/LPS O-acetylase OafA/YrhL
MRAFLLRRAFRILPPFLVILFVTVAAVSTGVFLGEIHLAAVIAAVSFYANYYMIATSPEQMPPGAGVLWSLAVEEHFYLIFPWAYVWMRRAWPSRVRQVIGLAALALVVLAWRCVLVFHLHPSTIERVRIATDTRIDSILFGCMLAIVGNPVIDRPMAIPESAWKRVLVPIALATLVGSLLVSDDRIRETVRYTVQGVALVPLFVAAIRWPSWGFCRLLNSRPVVFVGQTSYSFYLLHDVVLHQLEYHGAGDVGRVLIGLPISMACSALCYWWIEKPATRLRVRLQAVLSVPMPVGPVASVRPSSIE